MGSICIQICWLFLVLQAVSVYCKGGDGDHSSGRSRSKRQLSPSVRDIYTLDHFIELVEKIEVHPSARGKPLEVIANYVRKLAYDSKMWTFLIGSADGLPTGILTSDETRVLTNMVAHRYIGSRELGVVKTPTGNVAMGHVITGICAGANRKTNTFFTSIDNLYAATISGDLGQTALYKQIDQSRPLFGPRGSWSSEACPATFNALSSNTSEATYAELLGDIDGFLLGYNLPNYESKQVRLGQLLRMYYSGGVLYDTSFASCNRKQKFLQLVNKDTLTKQVQDFMKGFMLQAWYGNEDFSSVQSSSIPKLASDTTAIFFSLLDTIIPPATCSPQSNEGCELPANIIFVMDESGSIGFGNYQKEKNFVGKVLEDFTISPIQTRVAIIEYSSSARLTIGLDEYGSKTRLKCAIEALDYQGGGTNTGRAVRLAYGIMKNEETKSQDVQQIMILLTDGQSNDPDDLQQAVEEAKANLKGVTMIAIGVGNYRREELEIIATDPKSHVFTSTDFTQLADLVRTLRRKTCETPARLIISFRSDDGENKTVTVGFVSPGRSRFYALPAELFYGNRDIVVKVTPYFGTVYVYASRTNKNPGPSNYTFKLVPKGGESLNLRVKDICRGYNETTCPPLYIAIQGSNSKLSCHENHCTLPNQIKFQIAKGYPSKADWIHGTPPVAIVLAFIHFALYISF